MESNAGAFAVRKRPGGRTAATTARVNSAVLQLLTEQGIEGCTVPAVAARAGIERSTLYRRYPDRWAMIIDAFADKAAELVTSSDRGSFRHDLTYLLGQLAKLLESPLGPAVMMVAAAVKAGASPEYADRFWSTRTEQLRPMFDAAIKRGELRENVNPEEVFALAAGPIYFRAFISRKPLDNQFIEAIVSSVSGQYGPGAH